MDTAELEILVVCTGNVCRSPMAEALLRDRLAQRGVPARVWSAGTATEDRAATDEVIELMAGRKLDVTAHRSRLLSPELVSGADLILGMAREHVREAALLDPAAFPRTFTLKELVRRGRDVGPRAPGQPLAEWLAVVGDGRTPAEHLGLSDGDDIQDPIGRRFGVYKKVAAEIEGLTDELVGLAWPEQVAAEPA